MDLPAGYGHEAAADTTLVALSTALPVLRRALDASDGLYAWASARRDAAPLAGRRPAYRVGVDDEAWVVRHGWRGGAVARVLTDLYLRRVIPRPLRELRTSEALRERGVRTPRMIGFAMYSVGPFYRLDVVTRFIPDSTDLASVSLGASRRTPGQRVAAWRAAGELLRTSFRSGLVHPDLNLRNIVIAGPEAEPIAWLVDLDRAHLTGVVDAGTRVAMQRRLHRSRMKLEQQAGQRVGSAELTAFAEALHG